MIQRTMVRTHPQQVFRKGANGAYYLQDLHHAHKKVESAIHYAWRANKMKLNPLYMLVKLVDLTAFGVKKAASGVKNIF